jgi:hypothetical protein
MIRVKIVMKNGTDVIKIVNQDITIEQLCLEIEREQAEEAPHTLKIGRTKLPPKDQLIILEVRQCHFRVSLCQ